MGVSAGVHVGLSFVGGTVRGWLGGQELSV